MTPVRNWHVQNDMMQKFWRAVGAVVMVSALVNGAGFAAVAIATPDGSLPSKGAISVATKDAKRIKPNRIAKEMPLLLPTMRPAVMRPPVVVPCLTTPRKRMVAGERLTPVELRRRAASGDSLAAFNFAERLAAMENPAVQTDAVQKMAMAALLPSAGVTADPETVRAALAGLTLGADDALFAGFGAEGPRAVDFTLETATGVKRHAKIERSARLRAIGYFFLGMSVFALPGFTTVTVRFARPVSNAAALTFCPNTKEETS